MALALGMIGENNDFSLIKRIQIHRIIILNKVLFEKIVLGQIFQKQKSYNGYRKYLLKQHEV